VVSVEIQTSKFAGIVSCNVYDEKVVNIKKPGIFMVSKYIKY
jgi:hypothetical protein